MKTFRKLWSWLLITTLILSPMTVMAISGEKSEEQNLSATSAKEKLSKEEYERYVDSVLQNVEKEKGVVLEINQ